MEGFLNAVQALSRFISIHQPDGEIVLGRKESGKKPEASAPAESSTQPAEDGDTVTTGRRLQGRAENIVMTVADDLHSQSDFPAVAQRTRNLINSGLLAEAEEGRAGVDPRDLENRVVQTLRNRIRANKADISKCNRLIPHQIAVGTVFSGASAASIYGGVVGARRIVADGVPALHRGENWSPIYVGAFEGAGGLAGLVTSTCMGSSSWAAIPHLFRLRSQNVQMAKARTQLLDELTGAPSTHAYLPAAAPAERAVLALAREPHFGPQPSAPPLQIANVHPSAPPLELENTRPSAPPLAFETEGPSAPQSPFTYPWAQ